MQYKIFLPLLLFLAPIASAQTLTEDFESYTTFGLSPDTEPGLNWYTFSDPAEVGSFDEDTQIAGMRSWGMFSNAGTIPTTRFTYNEPGEATNVSFQVRGGTITDNGNGSYTKVAVESQNPIRAIVEFFVDCRDTDNPDACELKVRFDHTDTTGQTLINTTVNEKLFNITIEFDWINAEYSLTTNSVDDGDFPFLELPSNLGRLTFTQVRNDVPLDMTFDSWVTVGISDSAATAVEGDVATGIQNFANDIKFTTAGSLFFFGIVLFGILLAAVMVPSTSLGLSASISLASSLYMIAAILWLVRLEFWPSWIALSLIILTAAIIGLFMRQGLMGVRDASTGAGLVLGSIGYFIIATSLLAMSGFATDTVETPSEPVTNETEVDQSFTVGVVECVFSFFQDCSTKTETKIFKAITDVVTWGRAAVDFLFDLLTFQLPISVVFNAMIVLPPASALAYQGFALVRGGGS